MALLTPPMRAKITHNDKPHHYKIVVFNFSAIASCSSSELYRVFVRMHHPVCRHSGCASHADITRDITRHARPKHTCVHPHIQSPIVQVYVYFVVLLFFIWSKKLKHVTKMFSVNSHTKCMMKRRKIFSRISETGNQRIYLFCCKHLKKIDGWDGYSLFILPMIQNQSILWQNFCCSVFSLLFISTNKLHNNDKNVFSKILNKIYNVGENKARHYRLAL